MNLTKSLNFPRTKFFRSAILALAGCLLMVGAAAIPVSAQCGVSLSALAALPIATKSAVKPVLTKESLYSSTSDQANNPSIVGLWHVTFYVNVPEVGDVPVQEAFQIWNTGGTEVHNPRVSDSETIGTTAEVCLGAWNQSAPLVYNLAHRVWNYSGGVYLGTIHLTEKVTLSDKGSTQSGTFGLDFYDPDGNFEFNVSGTVAGERITPGS